MPDAKPPGSPRLTAGLIERIRDAEARYRLEGWRGPGEVVSAAVAIAEAGMAGPAIIDLAGDDRAPAEEVLRDLDRALVEIGLEPLVAGDALNHEVARLCRMYLAGHLEATSLAARIWNLWNLSGMPDDALGHLETATHLYVDLPEFTSQEEYRGAVRSLCRGGRTTPPLRADGPALGGSHQSGLRISRSGHHDVVPARGIERCQLRWLREQLVQLVEAARVLDIHDTSEVVGQTAMLVERDHQEVLTPIAAHPDRAAVGEILELARQLDGVDPGSADRIRANELDHGGSAFQRYRSRG